MMMTAELPAKYVEAYTVDGKAISAEKLAPMLQKEHTVLVSMDGKKVDPFYLQLYKEGTIILVPPANTFGMGGGPLIAPAQGNVTPEVFPPPREERKPEPPRDEKKPEPKDKVRESRNP
jgi:hypothetical protein